MEYRQYNRKNVLANGEVIDIQLAPEVVKIWAKEGFPQDARYGNIIVSKGTLVFYSHLLTEVNNATGEENKVYEGTLNECKKYTEIFTNELGESVFDSEKYSYYIKDLNGTILEDLTDVKID